MLDRVVGGVKAAMGENGVRDLIAKADAARDEGDWSRAREGYEQFLAAAPKRHDIWVQLGHARKELGDTAGAEAAYRQSIALNPDVADTHLQLGHALKLLGRRRLAEQAYGRALQLEPGLTDARTELSRLGWNSARIRTELLASGQDLGLQQGPILVLELCDLVDFLQHARYPTGIQRVQLELAQALVNEGDQDRFHFVYFDHLQSRFTEIDVSQIFDIINIVNDDQIDAELKNKAAIKLKSDLLSAPSFEFPTNSHLVNVGTSWGHPNYFYTIRDHKLRSGLKYVPLVHDCIPLLFPEFCNPNLVCDFINWISGMIEHADLILTNSDNTKVDLIKVAEQLKAELPPVATIRLNGQYGAPAKVVEMDASAKQALRAHNLDVDDFVLFVSTIEPRKNHMLALNAWSRLLKSRPAAEVPRLVCVGNSGWMNEAFYQRLERDRELRERVVILHNVPDSVLQALYTRCLFTLFPSMYEGWGLPISEAIAHRKVPLVSNVSSHPEAGGDLAVYFDLHSEADFQSKLEMLLYDLEARQKLEEKIGLSTPLRPWADIANEVDDIVKRHAELVSADRIVATVKQSSPLMNTGRYYSMTRNSASKLSAINHNGEIFRAGTDWHSPEWWGCWIGEHTADLKFQLDEKEGNDFILYLHWNGSSNVENTVTFSVPPAAASKQVVVEPEAVRWDTLAFQLDAKSKREICVRIAAKTLVDFATMSEGRDTRMASVGLKGLYLCRRADAQQRMDIIEAIQLGDLGPISRRFPDTVIL